MSQHIQVVYQIPAFHFIPVTFFLKSNKILFFTHFDFPKSQFHVLANKATHLRINELIDALYIEERVYVWKGEIASAIFKDLLDWPFDMKVLEHTPKRLKLKLHGDGRKMDLFDRYVANGIRYGFFKEKPEEVKDNEKAKLA